MPRETYMKRKSKSYLLIRNDPWSPTLLKIFVVTLSAVQTFGFFNCPVAEPEPYGPRWRSRRVFWTPVVQS